MGKRERKFRIGSRQEPDTCSETSSFSLERISAILNHASCVSSSGSEYWTKVSARMSDLFVRAAICLEALPSKRFQFISIGFRPLVSMTSMGKIIYREVNDLFAESTFGDDQDSFRHLKSSCIKEPESGGTSQLDRKLQGRTKCLDRWPMFYIRIDSRGVNLHQTISNLDDDDQRSRQFMERVVQLLRVMVVRFLTDHGFTSENPRSRRPRTTHAHQRSFRYDLSVPLSSFHENFTSDELNKQTESHLREGDRSIIASDVGLPEQPLPSPQNPQMQIPIMLRSRMKSGYFRAANDLRLEESSVKSPEEPHHPNETESSAADRQPVDLQLVVDSRHKPSESDPSDFDGHIRLDHNGGVIDHGLGAIRPLVRPQESLDPSGEREDEFITWLDPVSGKDVWINSRTGLFVSDKSSRPGAPSRAARQADPIRDVNEECGCSVASSPSPGQDVGVSGNQSWLTTLLKSHTETAFRIKEGRIPSLALQEAGEVPNLTQERPIGTGRLAQRSGFPAQDGRLSKNELQNATILGQVDKKFVLAAIGLSKSPELSAGQSRSGRSSLVLIDQHAADERCRVEGLFAELSRSKQATLSRPLHLEITTQEAELFGRQRSRFADWGLEYCIKTDQVTESGVQASVKRPASAKYASSQPHSRDMDRGVPSRATSTQPNLQSTDLGKTKTRTKVTVTSLPEVIAERCRLDPGLVINMLRTEAWSDAEGLKSMKTQGASEHDGDTVTAHSWLRKISRCPRGIIELLNARACRSAIMFNDILSHEECVGLLERLAKCAFPFQCAHGRPSMVVLGRLDAMGTTNESETEVVSGRDPAAAAGSLSDRDDSRPFLQRFIDWQDGCRRATA